MKSQHKAITILVLLCLLYSYILPAGDVQDYKLAKSSNTSEIEELLPQVKALVLKIRSGEIKKEDLPPGLKGLYEIAITRGLTSPTGGLTSPTDELTPEEIKLIEEFIRKTDIGLFRELLKQLLPKEDAYVGDSGDGWMKKLVPVLKKYANFFPGQNDREITLFLKSLSSVKTISGLLDLCLVQLLRPNKENQNLGINLSQCILEIENLLKELFRHVPDLKIKKILESAIRIIEEMGKIVRKGGSLERWRKRRDVRDTLVRFFKRVEKADIHHHLDGSISPLVALRVIWEYPRLRELFVRNILGEKEGDPDEIFRSRIGGLDDPRAVERLKPFIEYNYRGEGEIDWDAFFGKFNLFYHILNTSLDAVRFVAREASLEDYYDDAISLVEHKISIITPGLDLDPARVLEAVVSGLIEAERSTNGRLKTGLIPCIWKTPHFILDRRYKEVVKIAGEDKRSLEDVKKDILRELPKEEHDEFGEMCKEAERQVRRDKKADIEKEIKQRIIVLYEARKEATRQVQIVVDLKRRWESENPKYASYLIGLDTVGDEKDYIRWVTKPALQLAAQNGFRITEHLGENWHPGELKYALLRIKQGIESGIVTRVGHALALGIDTKKLSGAYSQEEIAEIAALQEEIKGLIRQRSIHIEANPSSNVLMVPEKRLRLIAGYREHPVGRFYKELGDVSINTDDSWILHTVGLSGEFAKVWLGHPHLTFGDIQRIIDNGFQASFIGAEVKTEDKEVVDLSKYHPSSIINRVKDFSNQLPVLDYQRIGDYPEDLITLEKALTVYAAGWEKAKRSDYGTLVAPAGMPAINMMVDSAIERIGQPLNEIDVIVIEPPYGCTKNLFENWQRRGVLVHSINVDEVSEKLPGLIDEIYKKERAAIIYGESVTNPNLRLLDIESVLRINRGRAAVLIDDTFATPEMIRSLDIEVEVDGKKYSVDMAMLGLTKGMTGTGNIISGAVTAKKEWLKPLAEKRNCLPEHAEIIRAIRGLRHLEIRFKAQSRNAGELIGHIARSDLVSDSVYPGNGHMIYYVFKKLYNAINNINLLPKFRTLISAVSLGQLRNLFERPSGGTHFTVAESAREKGGISPAGVRGSIGIENLEDVFREIDAMLEILSIYGGEIPGQDLEDLNEIFMAEYVTQEEGKRTVRYLVPKWPIPNVNLKKVISDLGRDGKGIINMIKRIINIVRIYFKYYVDRRFRKAVDIIIDATEITKYDPVTIAIHHRLLWCLLSGNHNSVIASPDESTTTHKQDDADMQKTFASILEGKKKGFPPDGCFRLYSRLGRPGIVTFELLMTLLEAGVEKALNYDYIGTSFYSERMAHKVFLEQQAEIVMMDEMMRKYNKSAEELEELRQKDPIQYHKLQQKVPNELRKEIIIITQPGSPLFQEANGLVQHDAVNFRVIRSEETSDVEGILRKEVSDKTVMVYFDSLRMRGYDPVLVRDIVKEKNPDCVFGITDSFNLGYENPRPERDFDFITHVIYYEDSDYGAVIIAKNDKPLTQVWNNPYWSRKNRGVAMSEDIATMAMWYILPYLRVFDERYEENINAVSEALKGVAGLRRIDKRHIEFIFSSREERERFLSIARKSDLIDVSSTASDEYFFINEWTSIRPHAKDPNTLILRIGIENTEDIVKEFGSIVSKFRENGSGAIGKGTCLAEKDTVEVQDLDDGQKSLVEDAIKRIEEAISRAGLTDEEKGQALQVVQLLKEYLNRRAIKVFDARVKDHEDYLLAFPRARDHIIALARDFLDKDYIIQFWFHRLPEILFHEGFTAIFGERDYEEHRNIYMGIQRKIFGKDNLLKDDLRFYINLKTPSDYEVEFDSATLGDEKLNLARITGLLKDKEFIYDTLKRLSGDESILPHIRIRKIKVEHGGTGSQKQTLHIKIVDDAGITQFEFALKVAINKAAREGFARAKRTEIDTLKNLSNTRARTPRFGVYHEYINIMDPEDRFYAYSEEWISGPTAARVIARRGLDEEKLKNIVIAYLSVMEKLDTRSTSGGYLGIYDVQTENVMFRSWGSNDAVAVDIGKIDYIKPLNCLQEFDRHYSRGDRKLHKAVFDGIIEVFGKTKGIKFLEEAFNKTRSDRRDVKGFTREMADVLQESLKEYIRVSYIRNIAGILSCKLDEFPTRILETLANSREPLEIVSELKSWIEWLHNTIRENYKNDMNLSNELELDVVELVLNSLSDVENNLNSLLEMPLNLDMVERLLDISFLLDFVSKGDIHYKQLPDGREIIDIEASRPRIKEGPWPQNSHSSKSIADSLELAGSDTYLALGGGSGVYNIGACLRGVGRSVYLDISAENIQFLRRLKEYYGFIRDNQGLREEIENKSSIYIADFIRGIAAMQEAGTLTCLSGQPPPLDIIMADASAVPLGDNSVSKVSILELFHWVNRQGGRGKIIHTIREIFRVTKPCGLILFKPDYDSEKDYYKKLFFDIASVTGIVIRLKRITPFRAFVFEVISKSGDPCGTVIDIINREMGLDLSVEELKNIIDSSSAEDLAEAFRIDNGRIDKGDLEMAERVVKIVDEFNLTEETKLKLIQGIIILTRKRLIDAKNKIKKQIAQYDALKARIGGEDGRIRYVLIDRDCLPGNQRYILEGDEWAKRKQLLEKLFPGYRFNVFTGSPGSGMDEENTVILTNKDMETGARLLRITNAGEDEYFPIDGLIFLGIGLLNLSRGDTPLAATVQNLYKELTDEYMDIGTFLITHRLDIKLQPIAKFDTDLEIYAITLLEQAA